MRNNTRKIAKTAIHLFDFRAPSAAQSTYCNLPPYIIVTKLLNITKVILWDYLSDKVPTVK